MVVKEENRTEQEENHQRNVEEQEENHQRNVEEQEDVKNIIII
jgi:hypothetical protein